MLFSVIVPNFNGLEHLPECLGSLARQTYTDFEVIVIDDASSDGSVEYVHSAFPDYRVIRQARNRGFVIAVNTGIREARGDVVVLLNNDTEVEPGWIAALARAFSEHPEAEILASKLLLFDRRNIIHSAGDFYGLDGLPGNRGVWQEDRGQFDKVERVFGACGGASAYRKRIFSELGLFDTDLWMYCEDVDLSLRANLAGKVCLFVPDARVYHKLSATGGGPIASFYCGRNFIEVALKNLPAEHLRKYGWKMLRRQLRFTAESVWHIREGAARARIRGQLAALARLPHTLAKRGKIRRVISQAELERLMTLHR